MTGLKTASVEITIIHVLIFVDIRLLYFSDLSTSVCYLKNYVCS